MLDWKPGQPPLGKLVLFVYYGALMDTGYADDLGCMMSDGDDGYICDVADVSSYVEI